MKFKEAHCRWGWPAFRRHMITKTTSGIWVTGGLCEMVSGGIGIIRKVAEGSVVGRRLNLLLSKPYDASDKETQADFWRMKKSAVARQHLPKATFLIK
jgi:hypothetical protein